MTTTTEKELTMNNAMHRYAVPYNAGVNEAPPPVQAMTADPTVVDAAVRFCDDVLASPTITLMPPTLKKGGSF
jgi:hypothetical protein